MTTPSPAERLGEAVRARRKELDDISQMDVWMAGGPSNTTLTKIENGNLETLTRTTARKLDKGLQWEAGSARAVWDGGEPTPVLPGQTQKSSAYLRQWIDSADLDPATKQELLEVIDRRSTKGA